MTRSPRRFIWAGNSISGAACGGNRRPRIHFRSSDSKRHAFPFISKPFGNHADEARRFELEVPWRHALARTGRHCFLQHAAHILDLRLLADEAGRPAAELIDGSGTGVADAIKGALQWMGEERTRSNKPGDDDTDMGHAP